MTKINNGERQETGSAIPSLRPHTMMIDLLFSALMLFAFQMGSPGNIKASMKVSELPTAVKSAGEKPVSLLPLRPVRSGKEGWVYRTPDNKRLTAAQVEALAAKDDMTPVLLIPKTASVQEYLDAEQPLRSRGLKVGLAVVMEGESR